MNKGPKGAFKIWPWHQVQGLCHNLWIPEPVRLCRLYARCGRIKKTKAAGCRSDFCYYATVAQNSSYYMSSYFGCKCKIVNNIFTRLSQSANLPEMPPGKLMMFNCEFWIVVKEKLSHVSLQMERDMSQVIDEGGTNWARVLTIEATGRSIRGMRVPREAERGYLG